MMKYKYRFLNMAIFRQLMEFLLVLRALFFIGRKYTCPCCGWKIRAFTHAGFSFKVRTAGYCPRCNSKARHRRNMGYLEKHTNLFEDQLSLFHVSPKYCLSRNFTKRTNINYFGGDFYDGLNLSAKLDIINIPVGLNTFDCIICIHVLEHVHEDQQAIREFFRVLKPGGWAIISVPIQLDQKTYEDPAIILPEDRQRAFGELSHVRVYGYDFADRLEASGFQVQLDLGGKIDHDEMQKFGLLDDENIFFCRKPLI